MAALKRKKLAPARQRLRETDLNEDGGSAERLQAALGSLNAEDDEEEVVPRPQMRTTRVDSREPQHDANHEAPRLRTRRKKATINEDVFYIPTDEIPEGSSYEWKRWSNLGQEDPFYIAQMREQGWEPVNPKRHPNWVPPGYNQPFIIKGGQILMERPIELTEEARDEQRQLAKRQIREAEQRLGLAPKDTGTRSLPEIAPRVVKEVGRMVPTAEE